MRLAVQLTKRERASKLLSGATNHIWLAVIHIESIYQTPARKGIFNMSLSSIT